LNQVRILFLTLTALPAQAQKTNGRTVERRRALVQYINSYGGIHSKDLDRECTHLVTSKPTSERRPSEKVKWALRELAEKEAARRAGKRDMDEDKEIKIVYEQWIWDCVGYQGRWTEDFYDARKARRTGKVDPGESQHWLKAE
jgi:DNA replication regulator DPB11